MRSDTGVMLDNSTSPWLAGLRLDSFPGPTVGRQIAQAAQTIEANILSPAASSEWTPVPDPASPDYIPFATKDMVDEAHRLHIRVKPWTVRFQGSLAIAITYRCACRSIV